MKIRKLHLLIFILICFLFIFMTKENELLKGKNHLEVDFEFPCLSETDEIQYQWNATWGGGVGEYGYDLAIDSQDNIYVVGTTQSFGAGTYDMFLIKYNSSGVKQWNVTWGGANFDYGYAITIDSSDYIYVAGQTSSFGTNGDMFVAKYNSDGIQQMNFTWGGPFGDSCRAIELDSSGNIYLAGFRYQDPNADQLCVVKLDSSGAEQWYSLWGTPYRDVANGIALDSANNIFVTGYCNQISDPTDGCLLKFNNTGDLKWQYNWSYEMMNGGGDLVIDSLDNVLVAGYIGEVGTNGRWLLLMKHDNLGQQLWNYTWEHQYNIYGEDIALDSDENIYMACDSADFFLMKCDSTGANLWNTTLDFGAYDDCCSVALDSKENVYLAGTHRVGWSGPREMVLIKYSPIPKVIINSPKMDDIFGSDPPDYNLTIIESNLDSTWYTLNDSSNIPFSGTEGTIDPLEWGLLGNGTISIKFYANNSASSVGMAEVVIRKDIEDPDISIISPKSFDFFNATPPSFILSIDEGNLNSTWYTLNDSANIPFSGLSGDIDPTAWGALGNGSVTIKFFANDTVGNEGNSSVFVYKDIEIPQISITSPVQNEVFGYDPPDFTLSITEINRNTTWYTLNGSSKIPFTGDTGTIDPTEWGNLGNGTVIIRFYINDSAGNENNDVVTVHKDIEPPQITVNSPYENEFFGEDPPDFFLTMIEGNPNTTWYNLNGGTNKTFSGFSGTIDPLEWGPLGDIPVIITFYANDSMGNLGFSIRTVNKDTSTPIVKINSPIDNEFFGAYAPNFNVSVTGSNLNTTWYNLNGGTNKTYSGEIGTFDPIIWGNLGNGTVIIRFYSNNSANNIGHSEVLVFKDIEIPNSSIIFIPHSETNNVNITTIFTLTADDGMGSDIDKIRFKIGDSIWVDYTGPFDLSGYPYDDYLISYYSIDNVGNTESPNSILVSLVEIIPEEPEIPGPEIPGYTFIIVFSIFFIGIIAYLIKKHKL